MGKGLALFGLILIIIGILPLFMPMIGLGTFVDYFYMLNIYTLSIAGYDFSELMLILLGLGVILLIVGAVR
ncbi:MAG: hypothetical protein AM325_009830 [Candidatus Thorarchaeota archaeon SMTZ1-45]|nr:MAG: hypothetical protein AM325_11410 [Candidatus Thorarchaeota archaeon SMTZ1-45]